MGVMRSNRNGRMRRAAPGRARRRAPSARDAGGAPPGMPRFLLADATDWASRFDLPPCCGRLDDATTWAADSYGPEDIIGGGGYGGFTAWYFPFGGPGMLWIVESVAADLKDTLVDTGGVIAPHPDLPVTPQLTALAAMVNALHPLVRPFVLAQYQWSGVAEQTAWLDDLERVVQDAWSFQHTFFLDQPCWEFIGADVGVDVQLHRGAKTADDHMSLESYKVPTGESLRTHGVSHELGPGSVTDARDQTMRLSSTTTGPKEYDLLRTSITFDHDRSDLDATDEAALRAFIAQYNGATAHPAFARARIDLVGRASSSGDDLHNLRLSRARAEAVRDFLVRNGLTDAPIRVQIDPQGERAADQTRDDPADRRVELLVDGGGRMVTAAHEFGHAFGLGDEYATATSPIGSNALHHDMAMRMTDASGRHLRGAAVEHTGGIMSFGNEVRPQHYATFHHALETVTHKSPWALGTPTDLADIQSVCAGGGMPPCEGDTCVASTDGGEVSLPDAVA